ncbi:MAG TPA: GspH/FimT family protein [Candidatus Polarisedimenticolaceae bacterium]|nr:GspH/FimT family protein [Candidatus Polarisedimenticolaceae bacterium]
MHAQSRRQAGFSLVELLAVLALAGIVLAIGIPIVNEQVRIADIRSAADQMAVHMRAARMMAVTQHRVPGLDFNISVDPTNTYSYCAADPALTGNVCPSAQLRSIKMPGTAKIVSGSATTITFKSDGSASATGTITIQSLVSASTETWTLTVNTLGLVTVAHTRT